MRTLLVMGCLAGCLLAAPGAEKVELRGAWVWGRSCVTQESADAILGKAEAAHLNALYILTFYWGATSLHHSEILPWDTNVTPEFDPMAYLVSEGHRRGIEIHAWFVAGHTRADSWVFQQHPEWQVIEVGGHKMQWLDLTNPEVRDFEATVIDEVLDKYDVDGVHFDYIRFENRNMPYTEVARQGALAEGIDVAPLVSPALPVAAQFLGNPVAKPTTARVIAEFDHGIPAIAVNELGNGRVILFNWNAPRNWPRAVQQALRPALVRLGAEPGSEVLVLNSDLTGKDPRYGRGMFNTARGWVANSGFTAQEVSDADVLALPAGSVIVIAGHYLLSDAQARALLAHVRGGGGALFIDAPIYGFRDSAAARELLGFAEVGPFFHDVHVLDRVAEAVQPGEEAIVPGGGPAITSDGLAELIRRWDQWRKDQVSKLVEQVSDQAAAEHPGALVTVAVFSSRENTHHVLQDWPRWVREGWVDYTIPMSYMDTTEGLETLLKWYRELDPEMERIIPSMSAYGLSRGKTDDETVQAISAQIELCRAQGARGVAIFRLENLTDEVCRQLGAGVFAEPATPYRPPARAAR